MDKKYISSSRYKKSSSDVKKTRRTESISKKLNGTYIEPEISRNINKNNNVNKKIKKRKSSKSIFIVLSILCVLIVIAIFTFVEKPKQFILNIFNVKAENTVIEKLDIAIVDNVDIFDDNTKNVVITELNGYTSGMLLRIDNNYNISYELLENVEKVSNSEYILNISKKSSLTATVLKARLNSYNSTNSKYYTNVKNIQSMEVINENSLKVSLEKEDAFFVYNLQLPIQSSGGGIYTKNSVNNDENMITYISKKDINIPQAINVYKMDKDEKAVESFKNNNVNVIVTNSLQISEMLGKYEHDIRSYRNGESLMLFGNKNSKVFAKKEVRQAIAYSIDRNKIKKDIYLNSGDIIDLPYLYSDVKYKYDIYGAQNILLANGYTLQNNVFSKEENGEKLTLKMKLVVNKEDETKLKVASFIKEDLKSVGIDITIEALNETNLKKALSNGNYDLVLADIAMNENPDITFIEEYVNINENVNKVLDDINSAINLNETIENVKELGKVMSDEVVCIGIHANTSYIICKKEITELKSISYMNIFSKLMQNIDNN